MTNFVVYGGFPLVLEQYAQAYVPLTPFEQLVTAASTFTDPSTVTATVADPISRAAMNTTSLNMFLPMLLVFLSGRERLEYHHRW